MCEQVERRGYASSNACSFAGPFCSAQSPESRSQRRASDNRPKIPVSFGYPFQIFWAHIAVGSARWGICRVIGGAVRLFPFCGIARKQRRDQKKNRQTHSDRLSMPHVPPPLPSFLAFLHA